MYVYMYIYIYLYIHIYVCIYSTHLIIYFQIPGICKSMINYPTEFLRKMSGVLAFLMQYAVPCVCFIICYVVIIRKLTSKVSDDAAISGKWNGVGG